MVIESFPPRSSERKMLLSRFSKDFSSLSFVPAIRIQPRGVGSHVSSKSVSAISRRFCDLSDSTRLSMARANVAELL